MYLIDTLWWESGEGHRNVLEKCNPSVPPVCRRVTSCHRANFPVEAVGRWRWWMSRCGGSVICPCLPAIHLSTPDRLCTGQLSESSLKLLVTSYWIPARLIELNKIFWHWFDIRCVWEFHFNPFEKNYHLTSVKLKCDSLTFFTFFKAKQYSHCKMAFIYHKDTSVPLFAANKGSLWNGHLLSVASPSRIFVFSNPWAILHE